MFTPVELEEKDPQPALVIHSRITGQELPAFLGEAYGKIMNFLGPQAESLAIWAFVAFYNMDMQDLEIDAGFTLVKEMAGEGEIQSSFIPGGPQISCMHYGPYEACSEAYEAMNAWISENGHQATGVAYEFYLNDPQTVSPDQIATQIVFPLKSMQQPA